MGQGSGRFSFRVGGAGEEFAKSAFLDDHGRAALVAFFVFELLLKLGHLLFSSLGQKRFGVLAFGIFGTAWREMRR